VASGWWRDGGWDAERLCPPVAVQVYERATRGVPQDQRMAVYDVYLAKASEFFGIGKVISH
jgi:hypothetical protein